MTRCQLCLLLLLGLHGLVIQSKGASVSTTLSDDQTQGNNLTTSSSPLSAPTTTEPPTPKLTPSSSTTAPETTPAPVSSSAPNQAQSTPVFNTNSEQSQRDKIKEVIENELSSDRCKAVVGAQASDDTPLDVACTNLESFASLVSIVGCTRDDYDKLHAVICEYVGEQAQRDKIKQVIENEITPGMCREILGTLPDDTSLNTACVQLQTFADIVTTVGCTQDDYDKLRAVICDYVGLSDSESTASPTKAGSTLVKE